MKRSLIIFIMGIVAISCLLAAPSVLAAGLFDDMEDCQKSGNCEVNHFILLAVNVSKWILGIVGSLTLLMFVYGGVTLIFSGGSSETVNKGKKILISAVIGLIIVFTSYTIIQFAMNAIGFDDKDAWFSVGG